MGGGGKLRKEIPSRCIPIGGIVIAPGISYYDELDMEMEFISQTKRFFNTDDQYSLLTSKMKGLPFGTHKDKVYSIFVKKNDDWIGNIKFLHYSDEPNGYTAPKDFMVVKYIYPKFRGTKYSRYAAADLIHFMFKSGVIERMYHYAPVVSFDGHYYKIIDRTAPCLGTVLKEDGPVQKYFSIKKCIENNGHKFALVEFNGQEYLNMDLRSYIFFSSIKKQPEKVDNWLYGMNIAAEQIRGIINEPSIRPVL